MSRILKKNGHLCSQLKEVETDQAVEEPAEIMHINQDSEIQFSSAQHHSKRRSRWVGGKDIIRNGRRDPKCPSARRLRMVRENTGSLLKVLPVPGRWPMKQLAVLVRFALSSDLLDDWSVKGILSMVFV
ncbi:hypothetical protein TNCV_1177721 [Trichonephila clavipes]|nr:hypothetical protein TNCV_1177721 [Trichonephila clavipes]